MPAGTSPPAYTSSASERLAQIEERLARLEQHVSALSAGWSPEPPAAHAASGNASTAVAEDFEFQLGQIWFARIGILALAAGGGFMLTLPHPTIPAAVPSVVGWIVAAVLLVLARVPAQWLKLVSACLRAAGMALLYCATLRLFFFGAQHAMSAETPLGRTLLLIAVAINLALALRCRAPWLTGFALSMACVTAIVAGSAWFPLLVITAVAMVSAAASLRLHWPGVMLGGVVMTYATYLVWVLRASRGGATSGQLLVSEPALAPAFLMLAVLVFGGTPLLRHSDESTGPLPTISALVNCVLGFGAFLFHTVAAFPAVLAPAQAAASVVFLGLAVVYRKRHHSHASTFFYAMTGYAALSAAIIKLSAVPNVFVWLSLQSVLVVATAIWFGSRFIVVANFLIYLGVVAAYIVLKRNETGISLGFGVVALVSARLLNWQQHRLELKTELMRNAYLLSGFLVFPYALLHLVPGRYLALAWVGLALAYYALNLIVRSEKYRWMGHATLALTTIYMFIVASSRLDPVYRVLSFLALGTALLIVSLSFTRARLRQRRVAGPTVDTATPTGDSKLPGPAS